MSTATAAVWTELLKARRSRLPWVTVAAFTVAAGFGGLIMFILQDVRRARALGLLGTKAALTGGTADWPAYFALLAQIIAVGGAVLFGVIVIWTFGREFSQGTAKDLLALPTPRTTIVGAKFAVTTSWSLVLTVQTYVLGLVIGAALGLSGWSAAVAVTGLVKLVLTAVLTIAVATPFALAASVGRGYLAGVGALFLAVFLAQVIALLGYGPYFPWAVPALVSDIAGRQPPGPTGYGLVAVAGVAGVLGTAMWWKHADQDR